MQKEMRLMNTVYFLDICAIAHIKTYLPSKSFKDEHHKKSICTLQLLDLSQNAVSCLPALMEKASDQRSKFSTEKFILEAKRDWDAMTAFFKNARIVEPWNFVESYANELFGTHLEHSTPQYLAFLQFANNQGLHNKITEGNRLKMAHELCMKAKELGISTSHPVVMVTIATMYGCEDARLVMKFAGNPKNFNPGNALADIQSISRFNGMMKNFIDYTGAKGGHFKESKFITSDSPLYKMIAYFPIVSVKTSSKLDEMVQEYTVSFDFPNLCPDLYGTDGKLKNDKCEDELKNLYALLGADFSHISTSAS